LLAISAVGFEFEFGFGFGLIATYEAIRAQG